MAENIFPYSIPETWQWTTLEKVCELAQGEKLSDKKFPYLDVKYLRGKTDKNLIDSGNFISEGSKVILVDGENSGEIFTVFENGYLGSTLRELKIFENVDATFFQYFVSTKKELYRKNKKGSAIPHLNKNLFYSTIFPLPPLDEQKRIVTLLDKIFSKLDTAKKIVQDIVAGYELRRAAILHKAFTGELSAKFRAENNLSLDDWQQKILGEIIEINPPKISTKNLSDDLEVSFFPMESLSKIEGKITKPQTKLLGKVKRGYTNFSEGDVVFAKITPCMENGKSAVIEKLVNNIGYGTTEFFVLRCSEKIFNKFLYQLVRSKKFRTEAKKVMTGSVGQQRVPKNFLSDYKINLPSLAEQKEIVRILDNLLEKEQRTKELAENVLLEIDLLKKSILARAFRGEL